MKEKLESGFLLIPKEILILTKVDGKPFSFAEKSVYSYLLSWSKNKKDVFPSMMKMCLDLGVGSRTSMTKYINKLEGMNLLHISKVKGKSSSYSVLNLDGKFLTTPNENSLIKGTNEERRIEDTKPKITTTTYNPPEPIPHYDDFSNFEDEDDPDWIPF